jgi:hypothetical protein
MSNNFKLFFRGYNGSNNMNIAGNNNSVLEPLYKHLLNKKKSPDNLRQSRNSKKKNKKQLKRHALRRNVKERQTQKRLNQFSKMRLLENSNLESNSSNLENSNLGSNNLGSNNLDTNLKHILIKPGEFTKILIKMMLWWKKTGNIQISEINFSNPLIEDRHLIEFANILLPIIFTQTKQKFQEPDFPLIINFNNSQITNEGIDAFIDILLKTINLDFLSQFFPGTNSLLIQGQLNYLKFTFTGCKQITIDGASLLKAINNIFEEDDNLIQTEFDNHPESESINNQRLRQSIENLALKKKVLIMN